MLNLKMVIVPVSILLKDGKGNVLKDVKMSKNGDSIKYSVEKAPKLLDVFCYDN